mgnify:CR=1 FL=1
MMTPPDGRAVVLELPPDVFDDIAAAYRSVFQYRRVVNGYSGARPSRTKPQDTLSSVVMRPWCPFWRRMLVLVRIDRTSTDSASWEEFIRRTGGADAGSSPRERLFMVPQLPLGPSECWRCVAHRSVRAMPSGAMLPLRVDADLAPSRRAGAAPGRNGPETSLDRARPPAYGCRNRCCYSARTSVTRLAVLIGRRSWMGANGFSSGEAAPAVSRSWPRRSPGTIPSAVSNRGLTRGSFGFAAVERHVTSLEHFEPCRARWHARSDRPAIDSGARMSSCRTELFPKSGSPACEA